jgi:hypothetical protein
MTTTIGKQVVQIVTAPSGALLVLIDGKLLTGKSFIFQADAIRAAKAHIEEVRK